MLYEFTINIKRKTTSICMKNYLLLFLLIFPSTTYSLSDELQAEKLSTMFTNIFLFIRENYVDEDRINSEKLIRGALDGLFEALDDPYSSYIPPDELSDLNDLTMGEFGGVGLFISSGTGDGVEVISPIEGHPAYKAGVQPGDLIIAIEGEPATEFDINDVVSKLRGKPGTKVSIEFLRNNSISLKLTLERALIEVPTVKYAMIESEIGYLRISQFTRLTPNRVAKALTELQDTGSTSLIIDLRSNPGGLLSAVVTITDYFLTKGPIVSTRSRLPRENRVYYASRRRTKLPYNYPIIVLIDQGSASASEILAAALKDTDRAFILGEKSYGKGSVQQIKHFGNSAIKVTTSRYFTPSGISIDETGVIPHKVVTEPTLSKKQEEEIEKLFENRQIRNFVRSDCCLNEEKINTFILQLQNSGISLSKAYLEKLVAAEISRTKLNPPIFNIKYDKVLQEAVLLMKEGFVLDSSNKRQPTFQSEEYVY